MIRDKIKDEAYFEKYLKYQDERIAKFTSIAKQSENAKGLSDNGTRKAYNYIVGFMINKLYASYSAGKSIEEIRRIYISLAGMCELSGLLSYSQLVDIASLAIILKPDASIISAVTAAINKYNKADILLEGFRNYLEGKGFVYSAKSFEFEEVYKGLSTIVSQSDKGKQVEFLADYIQNTWYDSNKESAWYNSHKSKEDTYVGYWCFEGLALAVALGLDINKLNGINYIPKDLIK